MGDRLESVCLVALDAIAELSVALLSWAMLVSDGLLSDGVAELTATESWLVLLRPVADRLSCELVLVDGEVDEAMLLCPVALWPVVLLCASCELLVEVDGVLDEA